MWRCRFESLESPNEPTHNSPMSETASIPALKQYLQTAADLGCDYKPVLQRYGLKPALLQDNTLRLPLNQFERIVFELINISQHPYFGLHASRFVNPTTYASLGLISLSTERLRDSLDLLPTYEALVGDMGTSALQDYQGNFLLSWQCQLQDPRVRRHVIDAVLSSWYRYGKEIIGLSGDLLAVHLEHSVDDLSAYYEVFGCNIEHSCTHSGLLLPAGALDQAQPQANPALLDSLLRHANASLQALQQPRVVSTQVATLIAERLPSGRVDKVHIAEAMQISARTLQRRLHEEGNSFQQVLNQTRLQRAYSLLAGKTPMAEIAQQLGFSETRSFFRRFKQWTGQTAGEYRKTTLQAGNKPLPY